VDIELRGIVKRFGSLVANDHVDLHVREGQLHCLLGENGAGKSTLMNVLYGVHAPDGGEILVDGREVRFRGPRDAIDNGLGMIAQHFNLVPTMNVAHNVVLGRMPIKGRLRPFLDQKQIEGDVLRLMEATGLVVDIKRMVKDLTVGEQQRVEILKALYYGSNCLILDEPTAVLSPNEIEDLFKTLRGMTDAGKSIIIITHKLAEAMKCDRVTVLQRGKVCLDTDVRAISGQAALQEAIFGPSQGGTAVVVEEKRCGGDTSCVLQVDDLQVKGATRASSLKDINLSLAKGDILGIAGVAGNGQVELVNAISGFAPLRKRDGRILLNGQDITRALPKSRRKLGLRCIPEDRKALGLLLDLYVWENMILGFENEQPFCRYGVLQKKPIEKHCSERVKSFGVKTDGIFARTRSLSGGNLQKVILARELSGEPSAIIAAQPTRGLDIRTADFVLESLASQARRGAAVVVVSYDLDEIRAVSTRVAVMFDGRLKEFPPGDSAGELRLISEAMTKGWRQDEAG
jgi:ABC-type uncharacterized transport system ATPase subunit